METVRAMFPNIPSAAIVNSLQTTGSVEVTIENALRDGTLPMVSKHSFMLFFCRIAISIHIPSAGQYHPTAITTDRER